MARQFLSGGLPALSFWLSSRKAGQQKARANTFGSHQKISPL